MGENRVKFSGGPHTRHVDSRFDIVNLVAVGTISLFALSMLLISSVFTSRTNNILQHANETIEFRSGFRQQSFILCADVQLTSI